VGSDFLEVPASGWMVRGMCGLLGTRGQHEIFTLEKALLIHRDIQRLQRALGKSWQGHLWHLKGSKVTRVGLTVPSPFPAEHKRLQANLSHLILGLGHGVWWTLGAEVGWLCLC